MLLVVHGGLFRLYMYVFDTTDFSCFSCCIITVGYLKFDIRCPLHCPSARIIATAAWEEGVVGDLALPHLICPPVQRLFCSSGCLPFFMLALLVVPPTRIRPCHSRAPHLRLLVFHQENISSMVCHHQKSESCCLLRDYCLWSNNHYFF